MSEKNIQNKRKKMKSEKGKKHESPFFSHIYIIYIIFIRNRINSVVVATATSRRKWSSSDREDGADPTRHSVGRGEK